MIEQEKSAMLVMLKSPTGEFRRSVRSAKTGKVLRVLVFLAKTPIDLRGADLAAVQFDIGKALIEVNVGQDQLPRPVQPQEQPLKAADADGESPPAPVVGASPPKGDDTPIG